MHWKDICRDKNGPDVCDSVDACARCINEAARQMTARILTKAKEPKDG
jgi:hypothetical protein